MLKQFHRFIVAESGVTSIEYALIASLIAMVIISSVSAVGTNLIPIFNAVAKGV